VGWNAPFLAISNMGCGDLTVTEPINARIEDKKLLKALEVGHQR